MARFIILVIIVIIVFSYFGISLRSVVESPTGQDNFSFVWMYVKDGWDIIVGFVAGLLNAVRNTVS
ncbi:MAG: hypothetical protein AB199_03120 [Parcubacteria bacterium C7867-004]|nr:MAG: hypothetical protein AB199_03120 [Parcubacteria bacterium C7867-004]